MYFHFCNDPPGVPDLHFSMGVRLAQPLFFRKVSTIAILFVCLISFDNCALVLRRFTASDWPFGIPNIVLMLYTPCPALHSNCVSQFPRRLYQYAMCYHIAVIL